MTEMSMNKVIHRAFRRDLDRFIKALSTFPAGDTERAAELGTAWTNFNFHLTDHHESEHQIAWPALEKMGVSPDVLATMDAEHDAMAAALKQTGTTMHALARTASQEDAAAALAAFQRLQEVTIQHLDHEEAEIEAIYLDKRDTPEMKSMGRQFGKVSPAKGGRFFAWVTDGASPDELAAIKSNVPGPILMIISGLFGRGYRKEVAPVWTK
jgi:hypothetical protein